MARQEKLGVEKKRLCFEYMWQVQVQVQGGACEEEDKMWLSKTGLPSCFKIEGEPATAGAWFFLGGAARPRSHFGTTETADVAAGRLCVLGKCV